MKRALPWYVAVYFAAFAAACLLSLARLDARLRRLESRRPVQLYLEIKAPTRRQAEESARAVLPVLLGAEGMR